MENLSEYSVRPSPLAALRERLASLPLPLKVVIVLMVLFLILHLMNKSDGTKSPPVSEASRGGGGTTESGRRQKGHPLYQGQPWTILEAAVCAGVDTLVVVHSDPENFERRDALRKTIGGIDLWRTAQMRTLFALGRPADAKVSVQVEKEGKEHMDIMQADFDDRRDNETVKMLMWMRFVRDFCPDTKFVLKTQDDVVVNLFIVHHQRHFEPSMRSSRTLTCNPRKGLIVERQAEDPSWYASEAGRVGKEWETQCEAEAWMATTDLMEELVEKAEQKQDYVGHADLFVTGFLASEINVGRNPLWKDRGTVSANETLEGIVSRRLLYGHYEDVDQLDRIWNHLERIYVNDDRFKMAPL